MKNLTLLLMCICFNLSSVSFSFAQNIEMGLVPDSTSTFQLDYTKLLISDSDQSLISGNYLVRYKHVMNSKINFLGEANFNHFKQDSGDAANGIGNIYLGMQLKLNTKASVASSINAGVFLPTASQDAANGIFNNFYDVARYLDDTFGIQAGYTHYQYFEGGLRIGFELASLITIPTTDNLNDTELLGKYGASIQYSTDSGFYILSELLGILAITEDGSFDENSFHTYALGLGYEWDKLSVGVSYKNYFDDLFSDSFNGIFGVQLRLFL